jgi:hypothetical protein
MTTSTHVEDMNRMNPGLTIVKLPRMTEREIEKLIQQQIICRIAFRGREHPYIAPFQYVTVDGTMYFHFTDYGRKMKMLKEDNRVCVEIENYSSDLKKYRFVTLRGTLKVVKDSEERAAAIKKLMREGKRKLSKNFLVAHGFSRLADWSSINADRPLVIVKLAKIVDRIGLKSS